MVEQECWGRLLVKMKELDEQRPRHASPSAGHDTDVDEAARSGYDLKHVSVPLAWCVSTYCQR